MPTEEQEHINRLKDMGVIEHDYEYFYSKCSQAINVAECSLSIDDYKKVLKDLEHKIAVKLLFIDK